MCKYSIITICRNAEKEIGKTIESVLSQNCDKKEIEMVIVDGLSTDNTKKIVEEYQKKAENVNLTIRFNSEKDRGIYDAMNKGAKLAKGEWCIYLNSGDYFFYEKSLNNLIKCEKKDFDIIYGDTVHRYKNKYKIVQSKNENEIDYKHGMEFCHQSCLIKTSFVRENPYTEKYKIAGDCDFFTRAYVNGARFHYIPKIISVFSKDGISSTNGALVVKENVEVKYNYGLVNEDEYKKVVKDMERLMKLKSKIPKILTKIRHKIIMKKATKNWKEYQQIYESMDNDVKTI